MVWRYELSEAQEREVLEAYLVQAVFAAECVYGKPRVRLEFGYLLAGERKRCVLKATGEAGEAVARIFTGLLEKWVGEEVFTVRRVDDLGERPSRVVRLDDHPIARRKALMMPNQDGLAAGGSGRGIGGGPLGEFLHETVYPKLAFEDVFTSPAHGQWHRNGSTLQGGCPWHTSKSMTAFTVTPESLLWFCRGCGNKGGGPLEYLWYLRHGINAPPPRGTDFVALVRELAQLAGVPFPEREQSPEEIEAARARAARQQALEAVYRVCAEVLWSEQGKDAREYLHTRGLDDASIRDLELGLYDFGRVRAELDAVDTVANDLAWRKLDGYITFPWRDAYGRPLTLYGRWPSGVLPAGRPKQVALPGAGSKCSPLYLDRARRAGHNEITMVEGLLDAAVAQSRGQTDVVAYVGSTPSQAQLETLLRHGIESITVVPDPDAGGRGGVVSLIKRADSRMRVYVAPELPPGTDPDTFIIDNGVVAWRDFVEQAISGTLYLAEQILSQHKLNTPRGRDAAIAALATYAGKVTGAVERHQLLQIAAQRLGLPEDVLTAQIASIQGQLAVDAERESETAPRQDDEPATATMSASPSAAAGLDRGVVRCTDLGNARRLIARHGADLRFCGARKSWFVWDGRRWRIDDTSEVMRRAYDTAVQIYAEAARIEGDSKEAKRAREDVAAWAHRSQARDRLAAAVSLAQALPGIPVRPEELDADPWLFNCINGTVDLTAGLIRPHERADLITKLSPVEYSAEAECPLFHSFTRRIMAENARLIKYLQLAAGYSLTGDTREQCLFLMHGSGDNGKSTLLEALGYIMGEYGRKADFSTFLEKKYQGVPNDIAALRGARFVTGVEADEGKRLAEGLVKQLTGQDTITARFFFQEFFEFKPQFKLFLAANHKPNIRGTDHAMWRRIRLIPFTVRIPEAEKDKTLLDRLKLEAPGILRWAVEGCLEWQREGLRTPEEVTVATDDYRAEEDVLRAFLDDECVQQPSARATTKALYEAYRAWCVGNGVKKEDVLTSTAFGRGMTDRGFQREKEKASGRYSYLGVGLMTPMEAAAAVDAGRGAGDDSDYV